MHPESILIIKKHHKDLEPVFIKFIKLIKMALWSALKQGLISFANMYHDVTATLGPFLSMKP